VLQVFVEVPTRISSLRVIMAGYASSNVLQY